MNAVNIKRFKKVYDRKERLRDGLKKLNPSLFEQIGRHGHVLVWTQFMVRIGKTSTANNLSLMIAGRRKMAFQQTSLNILDVQHNSTPR